MNLFKILWPNNNNNKEHKNLDHQGQYQEQQKIEYPGPCAAFLSGEENCCGIIEKIMQFSDDQLENSHTYIQYVFPSKEPSAYNLKAPVLTDEEIEWIKSEAGERARINLRLMYLKMIKFYGFEYKSSLEKMILIPSGNFTERSEVWLTPGNHNYKRITRILKCLTLCGMETYAKELFDVLENMYQDNKDIIGEKTFSYWKQAMEQN